MLTSDAARDTAIRRMVVCYCARSEQGRFGVLFRRGGQDSDVAAIVLIILLTLGLAVLLAALVPGVGFIGSIIVVAFGIAAVVWLILAGISRKAPSDIVAAQPKPELLGPDDPDRASRVSG